MPRSTAAGWARCIAALGVNSTAFFPSSSTDSNFFNTISADLASGKEVTLATGKSAPNLVSGHAYTLVSAYKDASGVTHYVVRNPWGVSGDSLENGQGYATLTFAQLTANFVEGCASV